MIVAVIDDDWVFHVDMTPIKYFALSHKRAEVTARCTTFYCQFIVILTTPIMKEAPWSDAKYDAAVRTFPVIFGNFFEWLLAFRANHSFTLLFHALNASNAYL